jgi:hypothetical protein
MDNTPKSKAVKIGAAVLAVLAVIAAYVVGRNSGAAQLSTRAYIPKGKVGVVADEVYVALNSERNTLLIGNNREWTGRPSHEKQVVMAFEGAIVDPSALPSEFALEKSVVVSFENEKVYFWNASEKRLGFYRRSIVHKAAP